MRHFAVLVMVFMCAGVASASDFSNGDIEWGDAANATLYLHDTLMNGDYTVKAVEFSAPVPGIENLQGNIVPETVVVPMVSLEIYKSGVLINKIAMKLGDEPYIDTDYNYRISVNGFPQRNSKEWVYEYYKPWVSLSIQTRAQPELEVDVITDKASYNSYNDTQIDAKVVIINKGGAFVKNVDVNLSTGELKPSSGDIRELHKNFIRIDKNSIQSFVVTLAVPQQLNDEGSYNLDADASGYDVVDNAYTASGSVSITVMPEQSYFTISKSARDRIYLGDNDTVHLVISNGGAYDIRDISLQDGVNENFALEQNSSLHWDIPLLKPGQSWETTYTIRPLDANLAGFEIPEATARFTVNGESVKASSEKPTIIVNGPIIILNKTVDMAYAYVNEDVKVTVSVNNVGDIPTKVEVKDSLPQGVSFVSGQMSLDPTFLELNTPQEFSYIIRRSTEGEVRLSAAVANYTDIVYRGETRSEMLSDRPVITFINTGKPKPTPVVTAASKPGANKTRSGSQQPNLEESAQTTPMTPGFASALAIITLLLAAIYRRKRT
jgi:uncharacterized repeat protein (TIGR01451 family)